MTDERQTKRVFVAATSQDQGKTTVSLGLVTALRDLSPVTVDRHFTREYIHDLRQAEVFRRITESFARMSEGLGTVVIEGTGHAGVGSCLDTSNADVARLLEAKVILTEGDSYTVASAVNELKVKTQPQDQGKIEAIPRLVRDNVDVARIVERM